MIPILTYPRHVPQYSCIMWLPAFELSPKVTLGKKPKFNAALSSTLPMGFPSVTTRFYVNFSYRNLFNIKKLLVQKLVPT